MVSIAMIATAQLTTANIVNAQVDWAQIENLAAQIAAISKAQITTANINEAQIDWAAITTLTAAVASIVKANIETADIDWAHIKDLATDTAIITQGVGGELYIAKLAVTEANLVSLTVGELVVKGDDFVAGPGHNAEIVEDDKGQTWMPMHGYLRADAGKGRCVFLVQIKWKKNWPYVDGQVLPRQAKAPYFK